MSALESQVLRVRIERDPQEVYAYCAAPDNLHRWASGLGEALALINGEWTARTAAGPVSLRFVPHNDYGVLDHWVRLPDGEEIYVPLRVIRSGDASEIQLTLFRQPEMSDEQYAADAEWVIRDLLKLKQLLED